MAVTAVALPSSRFQIKISNGHKLSHYSSYFSCYPDHRISLRRCTNVPTIIAQFNKPSKLKMRVDNFRVKLCEASPDSMKKFPWKKAKKMVLQRLLVFGERTLKWSIVLLFAISSLCDVMLSISRNRELMIPVGLFFGCMMADFLKEISEELFQNAKDGGINWKLTAIGAIFVIVKLVSFYFAIGGRVFLLHVGNGGLMQILWLWRKLDEERVLNEPSMPTVVQE